MFNTRLVLQTLRSERQKINKMMKVIEEQLGRIERNKISPDTPFITFKRVTNIQGLRSPHRNLKEALLHDLNVLRQQLRQVRSEQRAVPRQQTLQHIVYTKEKLDKHIDDMLKDEQIDADEIAEFQKISDDLLTQQTSQLNVNPSAANIKSVLNTLANSQLLVADPMSGASFNAFAALENASEKRFEAAEKKFRQNPTGSNLKNMYEEACLGQMLGGNVDENETGFNPAGDVNHKIIQGDTLSGLSKQYYGNLGFWNKIYERNVGVIGERIKNLPVGLGITIP